ncbi:hypothetical protein THMIRHAM_00890 [Thiomicrorhabdus immobilis]|uniref:CopL family metal-binding regulatory protein n=1 Tax=Thiomicrorhabdus immobilis TaxID=2791037 RepID=A0ABM7MAD8_9GAMM|nr:hypothetical protein [Thiomicrorhabdus immobilis]BCN92304.1 hypothetical protein THMIRHAM_00890 [Thiomicrorhabdus immobilis]
MKSIKPYLLLLLALSLMIRPVFAEGLMVYQGSANHSHEMHMKQMMHGNSAMDIHAMSPDMNPSMVDFMQDDFSANMPQNASPMPCCEPGIHLCDLNCHDSSCLGIAAVSALTVTSSIELIALEQSSKTDTPKTQFISRTTSPELRPPLFNA